MKAKVATSASSLIEHELKQGEDHGISYEAMRADRQERLKNILNNVVYTARVIDEQLEYIKVVGWNKYNDQDADKGIYNAFIDNMKKHTEKGFVLNEIDIVW